MKMQFKITVNGRSFAAIMEDTGLVNRIKDLTPFKLGFKRYKGHEYFGRLHEEMDVTGERLTTEVSANDIVFYSGENAITIFFGEALIDPYEVIYLGRFEEDISQYLNEQGEIATVQFEAID